VVPYLASAACGIIKKKIFLRGVMAAHLEYIKKIIREGGENCLEELKRCFLQSLSFDPNKIPGSVYYGDQLLFTWAVEYANADYFKDIITILLSACNDGQPIMLVDIGWAAFCLLSNSAISNEVKLELWVKVLKREAAQKELSRGFGFFGGTPLFFVIVENIEEQSWPFIEALFNCTVSCEQAITLDINCIYEDKTLCDYCERNDHKELLREVRALGGKKVTELKVSDGLFQIKKAMKSSDAGWQQQLKQLLLSHFNDADVRAFFNDNFFHWMSINDCFYFENIEVLCSMQMHDDSCNVDVNLWYLISQLATKANHETKKILSLALAQVGRQGNKLKQFYTDSYYSETLLIYMLRREYTDIYNEMTLMILNHAISNDILESLEVNKVHAGVTALDLCEGKPALRHIKNRLIQCGAKKAYQIYLDKEPIVLQSPPVSLMVLMMSGDDGSYSKLIEFFNQIDLSIHGGIGSMPVFARSSGLMIYRSVFLEWCFREFSNVINQELYIKKIRYCINACDSQGYRIFDLNAGEIFYYLSDDIEDVKYKNKLFNEVISQRYPNGELVKDVISERFLQRPLTFSFMKNGSYDLFVMLLDLRTASGVRLYDANYISDGETLLDSASKSYNRDRFIAHIKKLGGKYSSNVTRKDISEQFQRDLEVLRARRSVVAYRKLPLKRSIESFSSNSQNTHDVRVRRSIELSVKKLLCRYGCADGMIDDISSHVEDVYGSSEGEKKQAHDALKYLREYDFKHVNLDLSLSSILSLVWKGCCDPGAILFLDDTGDVAVIDDHLQSRKRMLLACLVESYMLYQENGPSCFDGIFNGIVSVLDHMHPDVMIVIDIESAKQIVMHYAFQLVLEVFNKEDILSQRKILSSWSQSDEEHGEDAYAYIEKCKISVYAGLMSDYQEMVAEEFVRDTVDNFIYLPQPAPHKKLSQLMDTIKTLDYDSDVMPKEHDYVERLKAYSANAYSPSDPPRSFDDEYDLLKAAYDNFMVFVSCKSDLVSYIEREASHMGDGAAYYLKFSLSKVDNFFGVALGYLPAICYPLRDLEIIAYAFTMLVGLSYITHKYGARGEGCCERRKAMACFDAVIESANNEIMSNFYISIDHQLFHTHMNLFGTIDIIFSYIKTSSSLFNDKLVGIDARLYSLYLNRQDGSSESLVLKVKLEALLAIVKSANHLQDNKGVLISRNIDDKVIALQQGFETIIGESNEARILQCVAEVQDQLKKSLSIFSFFQPNRISNDYQPAFFGGIKKAPSHDARVKLLDEEGLECVQLMPRSGGVIVRSTSCVLESTF
jgi:hypothetical protein